MDLNGFDYSGKYSAMRVAS